MQRTIQQVKEHGKNPASQTKKEEIGSLPEKEFRIMIVKMIQDPGKRMEAQTEKIQETFLKDLKYLKNRDERYNS